MNYIMHVQFIALTRKFSSDPGCPGNLTNGRNCTSPNRPGEACAYPEGHVLTLMDGGLWGADLVITQQHWGAFISVAIWFILFWFGLFSVLHNQGILWAHWQAVVIVVFSRKCLTFQTQQRCYGRYKFNWMRSLILGWRSSPFSFFLPLLFNLLT